MKIFDWMLKARMWVLAAAVLGWAGAAFVASRLEYNYSFWTLFVSDDPEIVNFVRYRDQWGEDAALLILGLRSRQGDALTVENLELVSQLEEHLEKVPGIESVQSILSVETIRGEGDDIIIGPLAPNVPDSPASAESFAKAAQESRLLRGNLISENGRTTSLVMTIERDLRDAEQRNPVVTHVDRLSQELTQGSDFEAHLVGIPVAQWLYSDKMIRDMRVFLLASGLLLAVILFLLFRSALGVLLPLGVVGAATTFTMAVMHATGEQVNMINTAIPTLMLVIGVADAIHLISYFRQKLAEGMERMAAIRDMVRHLGWACLLTTVTTAVGFASLILARIGTVKNFGIYAAIGIGFAFVFNMVLIPVGLTFFQRQRRLGLAAIQSDSNSRFERTLEVMGALGLQRPKAVLAGTLAVVALSIYGLSLVKVESRVFEEISDDEPVVQSHRILEEDLPGTAMYALDVHTPPGGATDPELLAALDDMARYAENHAAVDRSLGLSDILKEMNRAHHAGDNEKYVLPEHPELIAQYLLLAEGDLTEKLLDDEHSRTQVWMRGPEVVTSVWEDLRGWLERQSAKLKANGVEVIVTGSSSMAQRALSAIVDDILTSLLAATLVIFCLMSLLFRSLRVGLLSMVPNLLPLLTTVGFMGYAGINLRTSTVVIFSISLGLAVDDTIHFLVRFRREIAMDSNVEKAVMTTVHTAGRAIVYTSLLLIGGFWILMLSSFNATRDVGLLGGVTLLSAVFADLLVLPALLKLLPVVATETSTRRAPAPAT